MPLTLEKVEALAPDQDSLTAARKLLKPAIWPTLAEGEELIWGECQGSGATPYRVVVSEADAGCKCTCPSRKFPCKHALALMWMRADGKASYTTAQVPEWVKEWLSRRRASGASPKEAPQPKQRPSIHLASVTEEPPAKLDEARSAAARKRNRLDREASVLAGLDYLDTWLSDQVARGMVSFVATCSQACRTIAQRLVDAKASGLAGRLDALPSRLFTIPDAARPYAALRELGQIHLISQAYRRAAGLDDSLAADARQTIGWSITRETLLTDASALRVRGLWRVFAVVIEPQQDNLRRVETWLCREWPAGESSRTALLIDFVPIAAGPAASGYVVGDRLEAEMVFYRSTVPLRAQIATAFQGAQPSAEPLDLPPGTLAGGYSIYQRALAALPWLGTFPLSFRNASVRRNNDNLYLCDEHLALPLHSSQQTHALPLTSAGPLDGIGLWNGYELTLTWADTRLGRWVRS